MSNTYKEKYRKTNKLTDEQKDIMFSKLRRNHEYEYRASDRLSEHGFVMRYVPGHNSISRKLTRMKDRLVRKQVLSRALKAL
jgi:hypothetical protein